MLHQIENLHIHANDDTAVSLHEGVLHHLKPITNWLPAPYLREPTLEWQAFAIKAYYMGSSPLGWYDTTTRTHVPPSLEALRIAYPQLPSA